jgi:adenosylcobinamide-GDP ribazoletransferase
VTDGLRLAIGTFTALRIAPPSRVDAGVARVALLLAPVAVIPLGVLVGLVGWLGTSASLPPYAVGVLAVLAVALGTRAFHWDGLADVADGLTASYDRDRSLEVMRSGSAGPAGVVAIVLVAGLQSVGFGELLLTGHGRLIAALTVVAARWALLITCMNGVPAARPEGLGVAFAGVVPRPAAVVAWLALGAGALALAGVRGLVTVLVSLVVVALLVHRAVQRLGGVTGDVFGAAVELATAVLVVGLADAG